MEQIINELKQFGLEIDLSFGRKFVKSKSDSDSDSDSDYDSNYEEEIELDYNKKHNKNFIPIVKNQNYITINKKEQILSIKLIGKFKQIAKIGTIDLLYPYPCKKITKKENMLYIFDKNSELIIYNNITNIYRIDEYFDDIRFLDIIIHILKNSNYDRLNIIEVKCLNKEIMLKKHYKFFPKNMNETNLFDNNKKYDINNDFTFYF